MRHTFASRCFAKGIAPKIVAEYLGHVDASITLQIYTHTDIEMRKNEILKISKRA